MPDVTSTSTPQTLSSAIPATADPGTTRVSAVPDAAERMSSRHKLILVLLLGTQFMLAVDFSILNVALPDVGRGVGLSAANLPWVATAFALPAAGFTLLFGRVADVVGRRRMFLVGLGLLAAASIVGGLAQSSAMLLTGRVAQGMATAIATPAALSLLVTSFPEGRLRERALGLNGALLSAGFTAGAVVGGVLTSLLSWRWAFLVNAPIAVLIIAATPFLLSEGRERQRTRLDVPGAITVTGGLLGVVYGIVGAGKDGWGSPIPLASLGAGACLLVAFWFIELRSPNPLVAPRVLTRRTVTWGNIGGFAVFAMESSVVFLMTLYLQQILGYSPLTTGLAFGVPGIAAFIAGVVAPRVIGILGTRRTLVLGLLVQAAANAVLLLLGESRNGIVLIMVVLSAGFFGHISGVVSFTVTATSGLADEEQGLATGLSTMTQQAALTLGIPIVSAVATARTRAVASSTSPTNAALSGMHLALLVDVAVTVVIAALVGLFLPRGSASADAVAAAEARERELASME